MPEIYDKVKNSQYTKLILATIIFISLILLYNIYVWLNTQSTDNAYIDADISNISSEISGVVSDVFISENNFVTAEQVVAQIAEADYQAKYEQARANLGMAKSNIEVIEQNIQLTIIKQNKATEAHEFMQENYQIASKAYQRAVKLNQENFASSKNLDDSKIAYEQAKHQLAQAFLDLQISIKEVNMLKTKKITATEEMHKARQEYILAQSALEKTKIKAPISGFIGNNSLYVGSFIRPGVILFSVVPSNKFYIRANFKETQIAKLQAGMEAEISLDAKANVKIKGIIRNLSPATGAKFSLLPPVNATGNFTKIVQKVPVIIDFTVPKILEGKIKPGMSAVISVRTDQVVKAESEHD